jgi:hydroxyacylglutathione hydrolase
MLLKRFYDPKLAQASYLVGCAATGEALVVDPNRDVDQYVTAADDEGLRISHVTETHIHADFVSGSRELAARTGAKLYLSDEGGPDWRYAFAAADGAMLLRDSDSFMVGTVRVEALHTPGHTPEHMTFLITDTATTDRPMGAFTGDFIFVGDVGRPDLLERAAKVAGTMEAGARTLYHSIQRFKGLPDWLQLWPGHGAGSACGKALGAVPSTTLGYERISNWALNAESEDAFVREVLAGVGIGRASVDHQRPLVRQAQDGRRGQERRPAGAAQQRRPLAVDALHRGEVARRLRLPREDALHELVLQHVLQPPVADPLVAQR